MRKGKLEFEPGAHWAYSSTNFVLAGLLLARLSNATRWDAYGQAALLSPLPAQRRSSYALDFASHGTPAAHGAVRGFDRTSYNGANASARPGVDVSDVAGATPSRDPAQKVGLVSGTWLLSLPLYRVALLQADYPRLPEMTRALARRPRGHVA